MNIQKAKNFLLKLNFVIFPTTVILATIVSLLESYKYVGFFQKHFILPVIIIYLLSFVSFIVLIKSNTSLLNVKKNFFYRLFTGLSVISFIAITILYVVLNELEVVNYTNFVFAKFHLWPGALIFTVILLFEPTFIFFKISNSINQFIKDIIHLATITYTRTWKYINNNKLVLLLVLISVLILGYPLYLYSIDKSFFYNIDPDIVYTTNALLYTKAKIVSYFDHPGTPSILLFSYSFIPLRLIVKYFLHQGFVQWSFDNYGFLTFYLRSFQLFITGTTLFLFFKTVQTFEKSKIIVITAFLTIMSSQILFWSISIAPETVSLFITTIWLVLFAKYLKSSKYIVNIIMVLISGIAFANKFTNLVPTVFAILLPFFTRNITLAKKSVFVIINSLLFIVSFILSIRPVLYNFKYIFAWGKSLFLHAGKYGQGDFGIFNWDSYFSSISSLVRLNPSTFIILCLIVLVIGSFLVKKIIKVNELPVLYLFGTSLFGFIVFAKYPEIHYNFVNILLIIFCFVYFLSKTKDKANKLLLIIMSVLLIISSINYIKRVSCRLNTKQNETVNSILNAWTPFWSADVYREQLNSVGYTIKP